MPDPIRLTQFAKRAGCAAKQPPGYLLSLLGALPKITQATLGDMVGTTRSRVNAFLKHFERLGLIEYTPQGLRVHANLQAVVDGEPEPQVRA